MTACKKRPGPAPLLSPDQTEEAAEFYRMGASLQEVRRRYGVSEKAVIRALRRAGQPTRSLSEATTIGNRRKRAKRITSVFDLARTPLPISVLAATGE